MPKGPLGGPRPFVEQGMGINVTLRDSSGKPEKQAKSLLSKASVSFDQVVVGYGTAPSINAIQMFATTDDDVAIITNIIKKISEDNFTIKAFEITQDTAGEAIKKEFSEVITNDA